MRHGSVSNALGVKTAHRLSMLRNLVKSLVRDGRIRTTNARAKALRPYMEKIVTRLKDPTVANIRHVFSILNDKASIQELVKEIAPKFKDRNGGYLRILKLAGRRPGDNADMAIIEWVDESLVEKGMEKRFPVAAVAASKGTKAKSKKAAPKSDEEKASGNSKDNSKDKKKAPAKKATKKSA